MCSKEVIDIDNAEAELIKMDSELVNCGEMSQQDTLQDIKRYVAEYLQELEGIVYVHDIAEALKLDVNLVAKILEDLGMELE